MSIQLGLLVVNARRRQSALFQCTREQPTWPLTLVQGPARSHGLTEYPHKSLWRVLRVFYGVTLVWAQPSYMVRAVQRPALARGNSTGAPSCTSPATWFGPFNGLLLPEGTPQVHPVGAPGRHMRRCQSALFLWTREQSTWTLTLVQGPARSHGLTEYPHKSLWRVLWVFYWVTLVWGQPSYTVRAIQWPALARRNSTGAPSCTSPATWFGPFNGLPLPGGTPQVHPVAPAQLHGSGRSTACSCQKELHRCTQLELPVAICAVASPPFSCGQGNSPGGLATAHMATG